MRMHEVCRIAAVWAAVAVLAAPCAMAETTEPASKYQIAMAVMADAKWDAIRYDVTSGRTWHIVEGKWASMKDVGDLPKSQYEVHIVPLKNDWGALRIDVQSGRSWAASPEGWVEIGMQPWQASTIFRESEYALCDDPALNLRSSRRDRPAA
jgi:hypothetical protein